MVEVAEVHGIAGKRVIITERTNCVQIEAGAMSPVSMTPAEARYVARKIYRLARKVEMRDAACD